MRFTCKRISDYPVSEEDVIVLDQEYRDLDCAQLDKIEDFMDDLSILQTNVEKYGASEQLQNLIAGTLESWNIDISSQEGFFETAKAAVVGTSKKVWQALKDFIKKIYDFIMNLFSSKRTKAFVAQSKQVQGKVTKQIATDADLKPVVLQAADDHAPSPGKVTVPEKQDVISLDEHKKEIDELRRQINAYKNAAERASAEASDARSSAASAKSRADKAEASAATSKAKISETEAAANARIADAEKKARDAENEAKLNFQAAEQAKEAHRATLSALSAMKEVVNSQEATLGDIKKTNGYIQFGLDTRKRVLALKLRVCKDLLNISKALNASFETMTRTAGWSESAKGIKAMCEGKLTLMIPASGIAPCATEISFFISIMMNQEFKDGDSFLDWFDNKACNGCKYLKNEGSAIVFNPEIKKDNSTLGKLGYMKDYVFGSLDKKYEGTAAVVNKISTLIKQINEEIDVLSDVSNKVDEIRQAVS